MKVCVAYIAGFGFAGLDVALELRQRAEALGRPGVSPLLNSVLVWVKLINKTEKYSTGPILAEQEVEVYLFAQLKQSIKYAALLAGTETLSCITCPAFLRQ